MTLPGSRPATAMICSGRSHLAEDSVRPSSEKDFWVCWTLKRVFSVEAPPAGLLFKGGTSLSKVYKVIERFSEDIDLSFDRGGLGFTGQADPLAAASGKKRQKALQLLSETCREVIREKFLPQLSAAFDQALAGTSSQEWTLALAGDDPDQQTLVFSIPRQHQQAID